jgi:hypothetical protein
VISERRIKKLAQEASCQRSMQSNSRAWTMRSPDGVSQDRLGQKSLLFHLLRQATN